MGRKPGLKQTKTVFGRVKKQIKRSAVPWNYGAQPCDLGGTQTRDTQNRKRRLSIINVSDLQVFMCFIIIFAKTMLKHYHIFFIHPTTLKTWVMSLTGMSCGWYSSDLLIGTRRIKSCPCSDLVTTLTVLMSSVTIP